MNSSTSNSERNRSLLGTLLPTGLALATVVTVIGLVEARFGAAGGMPSVIPGMTPIEFSAKIHEATERNSLVILGDSRVGWGFSERDCNEAINRPDLRAFNGGLPACGIETSLDLLLARQREKHLLASIVLVNFSPAAFYHFHPASIPPTPNLQKYYDDSIDQRIQECLATFGKKYSSIWSTIRKDGRGEAEVSFVSRTYFPEGFYNARIAYSDGRDFDPRRYQLNFYGPVIETIRKNVMRSLARRNSIISRIRELSNNGVSVSLVRLPIGGGMMELESRLPSDLLPNSIARESGVAFHDYQNDPRLGTINTIDESHLTPESARKVSRRIGEDLSTLIDPANRG